jgi:hypothetical protein
MLGKATDKYHITDLLSSSYLEGVISLQYTYDSLLFLEHNYIAGSYLKWLLVCFEKLYGMKINYHKNDITPINQDEDESQNYSRIFCYNLGVSPFKYLGMPLHYDKLRKEDIQP